MKFSISQITKGDSRTVAVKRNIVYAFLIKGVSVLLSFLIVPLTLGYVNAELYGVWLTLSSIMTWLTFFDIGFTQGLKNKLGEALARDDWERGRKLVSTTYAAMTIIFIPLCVLLQVAVPFIDWADILNVNEAYNADIIRTMSVIVSCFCLHMILGVLSAIVSAFQKTALASLFTVSGQLLAFVAVYIVSATLPPSLLSLSFAFSCMPIIVYIGATVVMFRTTLKRLTPSLAYIDRSCVGDIFTLGVKFFVLQIQYIVFYQTTNVLISNYSGPTSVTTYNIAYRYLSMVTMVFNIIVTPLWPAFTEAFVKQDYSWMKRVYSKMNRVYWVVNVGLMLMVLASPIAYRLWIGDKVIVPFVLTLAIAVYVAVSNWATLNVYIINGSGHVTLQTYITTIGMVLYVPLVMWIGRCLGVYGIVALLIAVNATMASFYTVQVGKMLKGMATGIWGK